MGKMHSNKEKMTIKYMGMFISIFIIFKSCITRHAYLIGVRTRIISMTVVEALYVMYLLPCIDDIVSSFTYLP